MGENLAARSAWMPLLILALLGPSATSYGQTPRSDIRGIYVDSTEFPNSASQVAGLVSSLTVTGVDGFVLVLGWADIEPGLGQYQWTTLDQWMNASIAAGKNVELSIRADNPPAWLFQAAPNGAGASPLTFTYSAQSGAKPCVTETIAAPWDPAFLNQWDAMLAAVAAHLKSAGSYNAIKLLRLTGINRDSDELHLAAQTAQSVGVSCVSDSVTTWLGVGYRPSKLLQGWDGITNSFKKSFPDKTFSAAIITTAQPFPPIAEDGSVVTLINSTYITSQTQPLVTLASQKFPGHLVIQNNSLNPGVPARAETIQFGQSLGTFTAFQTNLDLGPDGGAACAGVPCTANTFLQMLETGIYPLGQDSPLRAQYIEVFGPNVNAFPQSTLQAHLELTCDYMLSSSGEAFLSSGGTATITITTGVGCPWVVGTPPAGVSITSATSGTGSGTVTFQVQSRSGGDFTGSFTIAGQTFTVEQEASSISGLNFIGSMPHLAAEENWITTFTLINKGVVSTTARISLFGDDNSYSSDPNGSGALALPLAFPQQPLAPWPLLAASFDQTIAANASLIFSTTGSQTPPPLLGSAQLAATGPVDGFAIFHHIVTQQEAAVPLETRNAGSYLLPFDNTNGLVLGVALASLSGQTATVQVVIRDDTGVQIASGPLPQLAAGDHYQFGLAAQFPITANKRGTIEFHTPAAGRISVLGLRFTPPNNALTTIPALANVGTGGSSIAHLASGGDGWQTTFVLVNTGTSAAQFTLSFFADQTGAPLSLPLSFPQPDGGTPILAPSVAQNLAAGATRVIVSSGTVDLLTGSAQITTAGHVGGFVIFRHNNQEAVVPLESRNVGAYLIAFDNTNGTATGVALNAVSAQQVNVPVVVRDDTGATIATDTIAMAANGHYAFTLGTDRYPATASIRGTVEFDTPAGAQIGALGIRIPSGGAHTYTTLPALAK
jgi:Beta-galactosidase